MQESLGSNSQDRDSADRASSTVHWDNAVRRFEQAWFSGKRPAIGEYISFTDNADIKLLLELVHADLEFRLRDSEAIDVTTYAERFPQISTDDALLDLIRTEWSVRAEIGSPISLEKYYERFPQLAVPLQEMLRSEKLGQDADSRSTDVGKMIGPYKLLQEIGVGGMGAVYLAEQTVPLRRRVALKVIKPGMDSAGVIARFEVERQALAMMNHPNIARVLDAGTTTSERPYFVMEYVKGVPITQFCDERRANVQERLRLFVQVCRAVQHAHQKGIVHRDLKPSNVLVGLTDGDEVVKIIDFGLAKALHQPLTDRTVFTAVGTFVGTLEYMSPEQAVLNALDIDTRSDVYSLGTLLYELLTGTTPLEGATLRAMAYDEMVRQIREFEPSCPSARLKEARAPLDEVSKKRDSEAHRLASVLRGELDWIVMKALEKDRSRRYPTVDALASDVQRFLANEPVEAGPPSASYRLRKLASKYRKAVAAAFAIVLVLAGSSVASALLAVRATEDKNRAESSLKELRATKAENLADKAEDDVYRFMAILTDAITSPQNSLTPIANESRQAWLQDVANRLSRFGGRPLEARVYHSLGEVCRKQGDYETAKRMFEHALAIDDVSQNDRLPIRSSMANVLEAENRDQAAIDLYVTLVNEARAVYGDNHWRVATIRTNLARALLKSQGVANALPVIREIVDTPGVWTSECQPHVLDLLSELVRKSIRSRSRMPAEVTVLLADAEAAIRRSENSAWQTAAIQYERALAEIWAMEPIKSGEVSERGKAALDRLQVTTANRQTFLDARSDARVEDRQNLAAAYYHLGKIDDAAREYEEAIKLVEQQAYRGSITPQALRKQLLLIYRRQKSPSGMETLCRKAIVDQLSAGFATVDDLDFIEDLGGVQFKTNQHADAEATFRCAVSLLEWRFPNSRQEIAKFNDYIERVRRGVSEANNPPK